MANSLETMVRNLAPEKRALLADLLKPPGEAIAIVGMACRFPGGADTPDRFWSLLAGGVDAITEVPRDRWRADDFYDPDPSAPGKMYSKWGGFIPDLALFDADFFGIAPAEALRMDPQQRMLVEVAWEALEHAGYSPEQLAGSATGVFIGVMPDDYQGLQRKWHGDACLDDPNWSSGSASSMAAGRLSYLFDLRGPSLNVDTACSSSLVTVHLACQSLRNGECSMALAGGVNAILTPEIYVQLSKAHMLSADGRCKTFDAAADGIAAGEGCGLVVLKRFSDAMRDGDSCLAVIRGSAVNEDGRSSSITAPNGLSQQALLRKALADAGVEPHEIGYVEAHGSGTALGDPIEIEALGAVLGGKRGADDPLLVGSVKTNIGHLVAAAGVAGLMKTVLALQHGQVPGHLNLHYPNPGIAWDGFPFRIPSGLTPWPSCDAPRRAGVSCFGWSGTNAHVVLEEASRPESAGVPASSYTLVLSARNHAALQHMAERLAEHLERHPELELADVAHTLHMGRQVFDSRRTVVCRDREEAVRKLRQNVVSDSEWPVSVPAGRRVALPGYPFERQRFWVDSLAREKPADWFYMPAWREIAPAREVLGPRRWLVFDGAGIAKQMGEDTICVRPGNRYAALPGNQFQVRPGVRADYDALFLDLRAQGVLPGLILHAWSLDADGPSVLEQGFYSLLALTQALGDLELDRSEITVVSRGVVRVNGGEEILPERACLFGPCLVAPAEYSSIECRLIDIDTHSMGALLEELGAQTPERLVALRWGRRWVRTFERLPARMDGYVFRHRGVFLITGAAGGIGSAMADCLARESGARLVLVSRSAVLPERIAKLEAAGAEVLAIRADVCRQEDMDRVVRMSLERFGALHGVMHAAGVPAAGLIALKKPLEAAVVLAPKVAGTVALIRAVEPVALDFLVLFSSVTSCLASPGQVDYSAANAFLDACAQQHAGRSRNTVSIAWGEWQWNAWDGALEGYAPDVRETLREHRRTFGISFDEGFEALRRALACRLPNVVVSTQDFRALAESPMLLLGLQSRPVKVFPRPDLATSFVGPSSDIESTLAALWSELLGVAEVGIHDNFFDLGGNSLVGISLVIKIRKGLGLPQLPAYVLYEAPTVAAMAELLAGGRAVGVAVEGAGPSRGALRREKQMNGRRR